MANPDQQLDCFSMTGVISYQVRHRDMCEEQAQLVAAQPNKIQNRFQISKATIDQVGGYFLMTWR